MCATFQVPTILLPCRARGVARYFVDFSNFLKIVTKQSFNNLFDVRGETRKKILLRVCSKEMLIQVGLQSESEQLLCLLLGAVVTPAGLFRREIQLFGDLVKRLPFHPAHVKHSIAGERQPAAQLLQHLLHHPEFLFVAVCRVVR